MNVKQYERLYRSFLEEWRPKLTVCRESFIHFSEALDALQGQSSMLSFSCKVLRGKKELLEEALLRLELFQIKGQEFVGNDPLVSRINEMIEWYKRTILKLLEGYEGLISLYEKSESTLLATYK